MKTLHLSIISISLSIFVISATNSIWAEKQLNDAIMIPFKDSELVIVGKIITANGTVSDNKTQYSVAVEKYLKNPKSYDLLTAVGNGVRKEITNFDEVKYYNNPIFEEGDKVFLYLNNKGGQYIISPYSFGISKRLPHGGPPDYVDFTNYKTSYYGNDIITVSGIIEKGYLYTSAAEYGANSTVSLVVYNPNHERYLSDQVKVRPDGSFTYEFRIKDKLGISGGYEYDLFVGHGMYGGAFEYLGNPLHQFKSGVVPDDIQCKSDFMLLFKARDDTPACVKPSSISHLVERGWGTLVSSTAQQTSGILSLSAKVANTNFTVNYNITGGQISEIKLDNQSRSLGILLQTTGNGTITIDLPRTLIDSKAYGNMDDKFIVLEDGQEVLYEEMYKTIHDRTLSIPFQQGTEKIEIIGTYPI